MKCLKITLKQLLQVTKQIRISSHIKQTYNKINWESEEKEEGESNVQIPKINILLYGYLTKIPLKQKAFN